MEWVLLGVFGAAVAVAAGVWAWRRRSPPIEAEPGLTAAALMEEMSPRKMGARAPAVPEPEPEPEKPHVSGWVGDVAGDDSKAVLGAIVDKKSRR